MAQDLKYGEVTVERDSDLPLNDSDEPVVVFRARDQLLKDLLYYYAQMCSVAGCDPTHLDAIRLAQNNVEDWQIKNSSLTKLPDTTYEQLNP